MPGGIHCFFFHRKTWQVKLKPKSAKLVPFLNGFIIFFLYCFLTIAIIVYLKSLRVKCCNCRKGHIKVLFPSRITFFSLVFITTVCLLFPFMKSQTTRISTIQRGITVKCSDHVCIWRICCNLFVLPMMNKSPETWVTIRCEIICYQ